MCCAAVDMISGSGEGGVPLTALVRGISDDEFNARTTPSASAVPSLAARAMAASSPTILPSLPSMPVLPALAVPTTAAAAAAGGGAGAGLSLPTAEDLDEVEPAPTPASNTALQPQGKLRTVASVHNLHSSVPFEEDE